MISLTVFAVVLGVFVTSGKFIALMWSFMQISYDY